jgi:hypothetical protein
VSYHKMVISAGHFAEACESFMAVDAWCR